MSLSSDFETKLTEEKNINFESDMKEADKMSELITNIFDQEFTDILPDILLISKEKFLSGVQKNVFSLLEKIYTEKIRENNELQKLMDNNIAKIESKYDSEYNKLKNEISNISNISNDRQIKEVKEIQYLRKYRKHCFYDNDFANHNCKNDSKFIIIKNKIDKIEYVICNNCHKIYRASFILCKCFHCDMEYYSEILIQENEILLFPVTWKKYHCKKLIYNIIPCIKCKSQLNLNIKTGILNCLNKECSFESIPKDILYTCKICKTNFNSEVIIYNPLNIEIIKKIINKILLIKNKAFPKQTNIPCCDLIIDYSTIFYHNNNCKGILYTGNINDDSIIICEKCKAINYYEKFIWTCPKCHSKFKEDKNNIISNVKEDNDDYIIDNKKEKVKVDSKMTLEIQHEKKNSLKRKYQSFRYRRNNQINNNNNEQKKDSLNLLSIEVMKKNSDISKIKFYEKNYYSSTNEVNPCKQKRFSLYKSKKCDIKRFKIPINFAKLEESKKENKNILNIKKPENPIVNNEIQLDLITKPKSNRNLEIIKVDNSINKKGRKSVYQYYKNLKSKKNVTENILNEKKEVTEANKIKNIEDNNNDKKTGNRKFFFDRIKVRRKTMNNPITKFKMNIYNNNNENNEKEKEKKNEEENKIEKERDINSKQEEKKEKEVKEFISHLNLEGEKIVEKEEEKEFTKNTEVDIKNINSTEDTNSSCTKSLKIVSKIPGMSDDLYTQIIQQINAILSSCKIPRFNLDDFTINRKIGEGSYGIIHSLIHNKSNKPYALKKIIAQSINKVSEFVKEFELVNLCKHSNILTIYGLNINLLDHSTYSIQVLMEKAERDWNRDIKRRSQEEKYYSEKELLSIMKQLTLALLYMKEKFNIAHRDIKPQNVLIFKDGIFKLADFGEAKEIKMTKNYNTLRGTELYMSPALYNGLKISKDDIEHDPFKSDLFSLGFCFIFAATMDFNLIYNLRNINKDNEIKKQLKKNLKNRYSEKFIWIISKMVELDEKNRFDFKELNDEIDKIMDNKV